MRITSTGYVGIGTTSPAKNFEVLGEIVSRASTGVGVAGTMQADSFGNNFWVNSSYNTSTPTTGWARAMTIATSGNVGIGTASPTTNLQVDATNPYIGLNSTTTGKQSGVIFYDNTTATNAWVLGNNYNNNGDGNFYVVRGASSTGNIVLAPDGNGNVGIGTSSPAAQLSIRGGGQAALSGTTNPYALYLYRDTGAGTSYVDSITNGANSTQLALRTYKNGTYNTGVFIDNTGYVGIGTASPTTALDVVGTIKTNSGLEVFSGSTSAAGIILNSSSSQAYGSPQVNFLSASGGGTYPSAHIGLGSFGFRNRNWGLGATIQSFSTENHSVSASGGDLRFYTQPNGSTDAVVVPERMRIDQNGNVGIGTTSPGHRLSVSGSAYVSGDLTIDGQQTFSNRLIISKTTGSTVNNSGDVALSVDRRTEVNPSTTIINYDKAADLYLTNWTIPASSTDNGYKIGAGHQAYSSTSNFAGTLYRSYGTWSRAGINVAASGARINHAYGLYAEVLNSAAGTNIDNAYGVFIQNAETGGTIGNRYDLYASSANAKNYFAGNVGIGLDNPTYLLQLSADSAAKPGSSTWTVASDQRLKDIQAPFTRGLQALEGLNTIYFKYKKDNPLDLPSSKRFVGIKAQDVLKVIPEAVSKDAQGYLHVNNDSIIWTAVNAIKELYSKWTLHDQELARLKRENAQLKSYLCSKDPQAAFCN
jgi:hypothetical protein